MARAIDADAVKFSISGLRYIDPNDYFALAEYFMKQVKAMPTLTPLNECVSRLRELDELYTKLHAVTGFTAEQLLEMFAAGYTLEKHDYSKSFEEMASLLEYEKEHANAYYEECGQWEAENTQLRAELEQVTLENNALWTYIEIVDREYRRYMDRGYIDRLDELKKVWKHGQKED